MKITKSQLKELIQEEAAKILQAYADVSYEGSQIRMRKHVTSEEEVGRREYVCALLSVRQDGILLYKTFTK